MPAKKAKAKPKKKQKQLPGIRVIDEAWELSRKIKGLNALVGKRVTLGQIYSNLMLQHGPAIVKQLDKEYEELKRQDKKLMG